MDILALIKKALSYKKIPDTMSDALTFRNLAMIRFMVIIHILIGLTVRTSSIITRTITHMPFSAFKDSLAPLNMELIITVTLIFINILLFITTSRPKHYNQIQPYHKIFDIISFLLFFSQLLIIYYSTYSVNPNPVIYLLFLIMASCLITYNYRTVILLCSSGLFFITLPRFFFPILSPFNAILFFSIDLVLTLTALTINLFTQGTLLYIYEHDRLITQQKSELEKMNRTLKSNVQMLKKLSTTDSLTNVANRRVFNATLSKECKRAQRNKHPLALLMIDIDFFKRYNDTYGHNAGDICIKKIAGTIKSSTHRPADLTARYGGEEFAVILPDINKKGVTLLCNKMLESVRSLEIEHKKSPLNIVTISIGCIVQVPAQVNDCDKMLELADQALYTSKDEGRNRITII